MPKLATKKIGPGLYEVEVDILDIVSSWAPDAVSGYIKVPIRARMYVTREDEPESTYFGWWKAIIVEGDGVPTWDADWDPCPTKREVLTQIECAVADRKEFDQ